MLSVADIEFADKHSQVALLQVLNMRGNQC